MNVPPKWNLAIREGIIRKEPLEAEPTPYTERPVSILPFPVRLWIIFPGIFELLGYFLGRHEGICTMSHEQILAQPAYT
jgi:hypothetical protein